MTDNGLVQRLKYFRFYMWPVKLCQEAAARIEALEKEVAGLKWDRDSHWRGVRILADKIKGMAR